MATDGITQAMWDALSEAFDPEDFKELIKAAPDGQRLSAYLSIIKLLAAHAKGGDDTASRTDVGKLLDDMFNPSPKK